ncbi:peptidyl-prolyl cis-trans isomerase FKBP8-like [Solea senegalensis]|uniref:peptidylprolyl isomerase n=1 Tax=Solea senegalensis TaxID=28829 RepID=A0AAV6SYF8_SOLSE|nr:FKBP prolyl isomerase 16 isoform X1 [Solea senegalensis]XP_043892446.1 FKBP prolyl isomerase 16 isoform X1 [Solea senegalensis]KAG7521577.1 peptidyl-prolyl cis-trans isomerase FKBP8-like [Solea senegalensis]
MVSIALCSEMETEPRCEKHEDPAMEATESEVRQAVSESVDKDGHTELPCGPSEKGNELRSKEETEITTVSDPAREGGETECEEERRKLKKTNSWKMVRFQDPSQDDEVSERDSSAEGLFPDYAMEEWTSSTFEELFMAEDWQDITEDRLLRKKVLKPVAPHAVRPTWGQEVTMKMQCILEDRTVVEKDCKLVFIIGDRDVNQALEECAISMQKGEITLLLADSQYAYGRLGRQPDIPAWAPLLYQLQLLDIREKPDPLTLPIADRIRIGHQKRERGNVHFQREEYCMAARAYCMALDVLTTCGRDGGGSSSSSAEAEEEEEEEEVRDSRVKCLNNLAAAQIKLEQYDEALHTSRDVLTLDSNNVKALYRAGKLLSDKSEYKEAMELLKKALRLEPATKLDKENSAVQVQKAIHLELSKLVRRQLGDKDTEEWKSKPAKILGENVPPFVMPSKKTPPGFSWKFVLGALVVALGSLVTSVIITARQ